MWMHHFETIKDLLIEVSSNDIRKQLIECLSILISSYGEGLFEETWEALISKVLMFLLEKSTDTFIQARSWLTTSKAREQKTPIPSNALQTPTFSSFGGFSKQKPRMVFSEEIISKSNEEKQSSSYENEQAACLAIMDIVMKSMVQFHGIFDF